MLLPAKKNKNKKKKKRPALPRVKLDPAYRVRGVNTKSYTPTPPITIIATTAVPVNSSRRVFNDAVGR